MLQIKRARGAHDYILLEPYFGRASVVRAGLGKQRTSYRLHRRGVANGRKLFYARLVRVPEGSQQPQQPRLVPSEPETIRAASARSVSAFDCGSWTRSQEDQSSYHRGSAPESRLNDAYPPRHPVF